MKRSAAVRVKYGRRTPLLVMRSNQGYYTRSHQNSEVKRLWAGIVLGWVTSREVPVLHPLLLLPLSLFFFFSFSFSFTICPCRTRHRDAEWARGELNANLPRNHQAPVRQRQEPSPRAGLRGSVAKAARGTPDSRATPGVPRPSTPAPPAESRETVDASSDGKGKGQENKGNKQKIE